jgi:hypothetical protein
MIGLAKALRWMATTVLIVTLYASCSSQDDEQMIRTLIATGAARAEAHDIAGMIDLTTEDIQASPMELDRRGIKAILWRTFNHYGPLRILYPRPAVEIQTDVDQAWVQVPFLIVTKEQLIPDLEPLRDNPLAWIDTLGERADLFRLGLQLIKQKGEWRVDRAFLERFTAAGFE